VTDAAAAGHVLDASALLSLVMAEPGSERVTQLLEAGRCTMSAVNYAEVAAKLQDAGMPEAEIESTVASLRLSIEPFDASQALRCGLLRAPTRTLGLSLGDRACLQLAVQRGEPVVTTDRAWQKLKLGVRVELLR
jgi:PIN domain nuclease of toxin-antitoxin system